MEMKPIKLRTGGHCEEGKDGPILHIPPWTLRRHSPKTTVRGVVVNGLAPSRLSNPNRMAVHRPCKRKNYAMSLHWQSFLHRQHLLPNRSKCNSHSTRPWKFTMLFKARQDLRDSICKCHRRDRTGHKQTERNTTEQKKQKQNRKRQEMT